MNTQEHLRRKRAIYTGLHPYLNDDQLMNALILWETRYANADGFSVRYFVADLIEQVHPGAESKRLLLHLVSCLSKPVSELMPDPSAALENYKKQHQIHTTANYAIPVLEAFQLFIVKWLQQLDKSTASHAVREVAVGLEHLPIAEDLSNRVSEWLLRRIDRIRLPHVDTKDLRQVVNAFYVAICEDLGPVKTDASLDAAIKALRSNGGAAYSELFKEIL